MVITWKRYAGHSARMKHHHKCMGSIACVALHGAALHGVALHEVALHGVALIGAALHIWGCTAWGCTAWAALHGLHCIGCIFWLGGGEGAILLRRACLIKPQFIMMVINADCRMTKS